MHPWKEGFLGNYFGAFELVKDGFGSDGKERA